MTEGFEQILQGIGDRADLESNNRSENKQPQQTLGDQSPSDHVEIGELGLDTTCQENRLKNNRPGYCNENTDLLCCNIAYCNYHPLPPPL